MIKCGIGDIIGVNIGDTTGEKIYVGGELVFSEESNDYADLSYIENTSTAFIDTGYIPSNLTKIVLDMQFSDKTKWDTPFGVRIPNEAGQYWVQVGSYFRFNCMFGNGTLITGSADAGTNRMTVTFDKNVLSYNNSSVTCANNTFTSTGNLFLFCLNIGNGTDNHTLMKIFSCKLYTDDVLIKDFVPKIRVSDGKKGLYDEVSGNFIFSPNNVDFIGS